MNNSYIYSAYQGNNMRTTPSRATQMGAMMTEGVLGPFLGKSATFYLTFGDSKEWKDTIFKGTIMETGREYTLITDATTNKPIFIWNKYIDYIIFDNETSPMN